MGKQSSNTQAVSHALPLDVTARRLDADPNATSTGVEVMLCFMKVRFLAATSASLNSLTILSSQAVARQEPSALKARPPTWSVCPCSSLACQDVARVEVDCVETAAGYAIICRRLVHQMGQL